MATIISGKYRNDRLTNLSHSSGTVFMPAGAVLTIGGLQFTTDAQKSVSLPAMSANLRYQIFAVRSGNDVALVVSINENSVGPTGYTSWRLVGSLHANETGAFGSFLNITNKPESQSAVTHTPVISHLTGGITNITVSGQWKRDGSKLVGRGIITFSTTSAAFNGIEVAMPTNLVMNSSDMLSLVDSATSIGQGRLLDFNNLGYTGDVTTVTSTRFGVVKIATVSGANPINVAASRISNTDPFTFNTNDTISWEYTVDVVGWLNTPIQDL